MKFNVGDKVKIVKMDNNIIENVNIGDVGIITKILDKNFDYPIRIKMNNIEGCLVFKEEELELFREEDRAEKTFKEVIADIKEGEVWESKFKTINRTHSAILISEKNNKETSLFGFDDNIKYTLKRKQYTFQEAFKAYEEGKEIESIEFRYKKENGIDGFFNRGEGNWINCNLGLDIEVNEIRNKWYINE